MLKVFSCQGSSFFRKTPRKLTPTAVHENWLGLSARITRLSHTVESAATTS